jgi:uncharacterized membrane protein
MLLESIKNLPPELATLLMAMLPVTELRLAIPFAIGVLKMPIWQAFIFSVIGNIIPAVIIVWFLKPLADWLSAKSKFFHRFFTWWFERTIKNFSTKYEKYGLWALMLFVAIPLPVTGAWTGAIAAFLFNIPRKKAIFFIFLGVIIAGVIVSLLTTGAISLVNNQHL